MLCAIARLVGVYEHCQEIGDDMGEMTLDAVRDLLADKQTAEANVARLTKERDWLANQQQGVPAFLGVPLPPAVYPTIFKGPRFARSFVGRFAPGAASITSGFGVA